MKNAQEMREITNKSINTDSEKSKEIFDYISKQVEKSAYSGNYYTNVDLENYSLPSSYRSYIKDELENLGYEVDFFYGDFNGGIIRNIIIRWGK